jgi:hypothetical protein
MSMPAGSEGPADGGCPPVIGRTPPSAPGTGDDDTGVECIMGQCMGCLFVMIGPEGADVYKIGGGVYICCRPGWLESGWLHLCCWHRCRARCSGLGWRHHRCRACMCLQTPVPGTCRVSNSDVDRCATSRLLVSNQIVFVADQGSDQGQHHDPAAEAVCMTQVIIVPG